jgi:hypothetical protein
MGLLALLALPFVLYLLFILLAFGLSLPLFPDPGEGASLLCVALFMAGLIVFGLTREWWRHRHDRGPTDEEIEAERRLPPPFRWPDRPKPE